MRNEKYTKLNRVFGVLSPSHGRSSNCVVKPWNSTLRILFGLLFIGALIFNKRLAVI